MTSAFRGIYPAMITPMTESEEIDLAKLEALVEYLIGAGVHGLIPLGSTGEFYALSPQERRDVLATVIRADGGPRAGRGGRQCGGRRAKSCSMPARRKHWAPRRHGRAALLLAAARPMSCWNTFAPSMRPSASRSCSTISPPHRRRYAAGVCLSGWPN